ncbi:fructosamine kinase family protein [Salisediminibacterium halotolerans]|uniref:Fructosamine-3-kinase n=1 Tax=Salisediminibacterium halotolerans TaxID=517425 RepID=A0A1H9WFV8_9BACI|nr:fructosamine kinase family protein [Salisediminibacterium haloalkalitolerans]SES32715.1 Fructosamine-3-kinase [Salisediminibacterium haloalkalitolerans]
MRIIEEALAQIGIDEEFETYERLGGGDINEAYRLNTSEGSYFLKLKKKAPEAFFEAEKQGLDALINQAGVHAPKPLGLYRSDSSGYAGLLLEWIETDKTPARQADLGYETAKLHRTGAGYYGYTSDTYIGELPQPNGAFSSWLEYYRDRRIGKQAELAKNRGLLPVKRAERLTKLREQLERWIPAEPHASLLHGDLWGGNWLAGPGGQPYFIDPSVLYGDRELDIAFSKLFGGFSAEFYSAYQADFPLAYNWKEREPLYQLFYLLVHLNMFGEVYGKSVDRILKHYIG